MSRALAYRTTFQGLGISIENAVGSIRTGVGHDGTPWEVIMTCPYGYIRNTEGTDGDHVDCFLGPNEQATHAYVIHAMQAGDLSRYDEDKVMLGFDSAEHAKQTFLDNYTKPEFFGGMHIIAMPEFIEKVLATKEHPAMIKASSIEDTKDYLAESEQIKKNRTDPANQLAHQFVAARWTWPNGHPRCLLCGQEEPTSGLCQPSREIQKSIGLGLPFLVLFGKAHVQQHSRTSKTGEVAVVRQHERKVNTRYPGNKQPWEMTQREFMAHHKTGHIPSDAYDRYKTSDGISSFVKLENYPDHLEFKVIDGVEIDIRESNRPLQYTKIVDDKIVRDEHGMAVMMTEDEMKAQGLPMRSHDLAAFIGDVPIAFASNEFGTAGVWVVEKWQRKGLGRYLLAEFMERHPHIKKIGQMTGLGDNMTRAYHTDLVRNAIANGKPVPAHVRKDYEETMEFKRTVVIPAEVMDTDGPVVVEFNRI